MTDQNFSIPAQTNQTLNVSVVDPEDSPVDITGANIVWYASTGPGGQSITKTLINQISNGITITNPSGGLFVISIEPVDTTQPAGFGDAVVYTHECRMYLYPYNEVIMSGEMDVYPSLTAGML